MCMRQIRQKNNRLQSNVLTELRLLAGELY